MAKAALARSLGVSRASLYYASRMEKKDWATKTRMEEVLREHPSYGSRRLRQALQIGREQARRVMRKYGIRPYRRRGRKWHKKRTIKVRYSNLLLGIIPRYPHHIWAADFTEIWYRGRWVYIATVIDLFTRRIVGMAVSLRKGAPLTIQALWNALLHYPHPTIFHSDNGKEYEAGAFIAVLEEVGSRISRSHPGCPWENGYQESFYDKFKVDFGDPSRFTTFGELVAEIYRTIWVYNHTRIHSALNMPPVVFAESLVALKNGEKLLRMAV
ncbi:MAG: IS3 family transposase [Patescibacteria group bacterium]